MGESYTMDGEYDEFVGGASKFGMYNYGNLIDVPDEINNTVRPIDYVIGKIKNLQKNRHLPQFMVVEGKTGSGKTLIMPAEIYVQLGQAPVVVSVPLVKTAISMPTVVEIVFPTIKHANAVGYSTSSNSTAKGKLDFVTTYILVLQIREALSVFRRTNGNMNMVEAVFPYKYIVLDEVHQHKDTNDLLLTLVKQMIYEFKNFSPFVVATSATIDYRLFLRYYGVPDNGMHLVRISGASAKQTIKFLEKDAEDWEQEILKIVVKICTEIDPSPNYDNSPGDIAIFIPTVKSGTKIKQLIDEWAAKNKYPLFCILATSALINTDGTVEKNLIEAVNPRLLMKRELKRLVIIGTDSIETGVTLHNLTHVIECGYKFEISYNPFAGASFEIKIPISRSNAIQRMGRVGRNRAGTAYPVYTESTFQKMREDLLPFTYTDDFSTSLLFLKSIDINPLSLILPPPYEMLYNAEDKLYLLGLIDDDNKITELGSFVYRIPMLPIEAIVVIFSGFIYDVCAADLLTMVCIAQNMSTSNTPSIIGIDDTFISGLMMCERILYAEELQRYDYKFSSELWDQDKLNEALKLRTDIIGYFARTGISLFNKPSEIQSMLFAADINSEEFKDYIRRLKQCIYEGYKINLLTHVKDNLYSTIRGYTVDVNFKIYGTNNETYKKMGLSNIDMPYYIVTDQLRYRENFKSGIGLSVGNISVLDGYITPIIDKLPPYTQRAVEPLSEEQLREYRATILGRERMSKRLLYGGSNCLLPEVD